MSNEGFSELLRSVVYVIEKTASEEIHVAVLPNGNVDVRIWIYGREGLMPTRKGIRLSPSQRNELIEALQSTKETHEQGSAGDPA